MKYSDKMGKYMIKFYKIWQFLKKFIKSSYDLTICNSWLVKYFIISVLNPSICSRKNQNKNFYTIPACKANICIDVNPVILLHKALNGPGSVNWDTQGGGAPGKAHKQSNEKRHQFWHRQPPSHRLGRHNAPAPYLQRQEEGRQICTGWKHSHGRNGQNQLLPSSINVAPTFTVQQLTSNWSYPWPVMTG